MYQRTMPTSLDLILVGQANLLLLIRNLRQKSSFRKLSMQPNQLLEMAAFFDSASFDRQPKLRVHYRAA